MPPTTKAEDLVTCLVVPRLKLKAYCTFLLSQWYIQLGARLVCVLCDYFAPVLDIILALSIWAGEGGEPRSISPTFSCTSNTRRFLYPTSQTRHWLHSLSNTDDSAVCDMWRYTFVVFFCLCHYSLFYLFLFVFLVLTLLLILICFAGGKRILERSLYRMTVSSVVGINIGLVWFPVLSVIQRIIWHFMLYKRCADWPCCSSGG
jgi:hypothetical protein